MRWLSAWRVRLRSLFRREQLEDEMDAELRFHLDQQITENLQAGMPLEEAAQAARKSFGDPIKVKEETRDLWRWAWWDAWCQDLRLATRLLLKQRGFSTLAVIVLALGTGANTAVFSAANVVLFKPLPVDDPDYCSRGRSPESMKSACGLRSAPDVAAWSGSS